MSTEAPTLFTPFSLRDVIFKNRIVVSPMCQYAARDGFANDWHYAHHARFALGGVGGAVVESTAVTPGGRITHECLGLWKDEQIDALRRIVALYHSHAIPVGIQIGHSGRKGSAAMPFDGAQPLQSCDPARAWECIAPSPIAVAEGWPIPRELEGSEIPALIDAFGATAARAVAAGFDFIEVHGAHGYLIHSFLSPITNQRRDEWGGNLNRRRQFALLVAERIREVLPAWMPLLFRLSCVDGVPGGVTLEDTIELAIRLKARGVDCIDCSSGGLTGPSGLATLRPAPGYLVPYAREVHLRADIPTMATGLITTAALANEIVAMGNAQLLAIGRQLLADPSFAYRAAIELELADPHSVLPMRHAHFLRRRADTFALRANK